MFPYFLFRHPHVKQSNDDKQKRHKGNHLNERLGEIGEDGFAGVKPQHERKYGKDDEGRQPNVTAVLLQESFHIISPTSRPIATAAKKFSTFRVIATLLPKYLISSGSVTTPTIIKVVMNVATTA